MPLEKEIDMLGFGPGEILIPIVVIITVFSFTAVVSWAKERRKEREAYYKSETLKKLAESGPGAAAVLELMREEDRVARRKAREGMTIGGLVNIGVGIALVIFLRAIAHNQPAVGYVGLIPLVVGVALLIYIYILGPKE